MFLNPSVAFSPMQCVFQQLDGTVNLLSACVLPGTEPGFFNHTNPSPTLKFGILSR